MVFVPRTDWKDRPDLTTPIMAADLIRIELGVADADSKADAAESAAANAQSTADTAESAAANAQSTADAAESAAANAQSTADAALVGYIVAANGSPVSGKQVVPVMDEFGDLDNIVIEDV